MLSHFEASRSMFHPRFSLLQDPDVYCEPRRGKKEDPGCFKSTRQDKLFAVLVCSPISSSPHSWDKLVRSDVADKILTRLEFSWGEGVQSIFNIFIQLINQFLPSIFIRVMHGLNLGCRIIHVSKTTIFMINSYYDISDKRVPAES